jgi:hypothetical protein
VSGTISPGTISLGPQAPMQCRTHMRTPFVKRHTTPMSGVFAFFPLSRTWRSLQSVACSDFISMGRCQPGVAAPNTY